MERSSGFGFGTETPAVRTILSPTSLAVRELVSFLQCYRRRYTR